MDWPSAWYEPGRERMGREDCMEGKSHIWKLVTAVALYVVLFFGTIGLFYDRGFHALSPVYILNIGIDLFGMLAGIVLYICCQIDIQKADVDNRYYMYLLNVVFMGLFTDAMAWLVDGVPDLRGANVIDNTLYYMCSAFAACFFWHYVVHFMHSTRKLTKWFTYFVRIGLAVNQCAVLLNLVFGFYFTVDAQGVYHRCGMYSLSLIYAYLTMLFTLALALLERKRLHTFQLVAVIAYVVLPVAVGLVTVRIYGLSVSYGMNLIVMLLMYCLLNVTQGREKAVSDSELATAASIQESMLPNTFPAFPDREDFDIHATMTPAREVGGDFYDFFLTDEDHLVMVIADVSGKGVPAALFMTVSKLLINEAAISGKKPREILSAVNDRICGNNNMNMFVTVWIGILELSTGKVTAANAGHEDPVLCRYSGGCELYKTKHSMMVGVMEGVPFDEYTFRLEKGDKLFLYTDGVPEATDGDQNMFGVAKMIKTLEKTAGEDVRETLARVRQDVDEFVGEAEQFDDLTMLCVERL